MHPPRTTSKLPCLSPGAFPPKNASDRAIEIAAACGAPLRIAAKVDAVNRDYFESAIEPLLDNPLVTLVGEIGGPGEEAGFHRATRARS